MAKNRLLVFGNSYMNFYMKVRRAPERSETVLSNLEHYFTPGGHGVVSAVTSARYGTDVIFCTRLGEDENAEKLIKVFKSNNIDTRFIKTDKRKPTGLNAITIEDKNKMRTITYNGANSSLCYDDIESAFMCYPDAVLLNFDLKDDFILDTVKFAHQNNVPIIISCGDELQDFDIQDLEQVDIFSPNREAVYKITGIDPIDTNSALHACVKIIGKIKCKYIVMKLGDRGTFVFDGVYSEIIPALDVEVEDTTMAGTIFTSALAHAYLECGNISKAAAFANAAASLSVTKEGAFSAIPDFDEVSQIVSNT